MVNRPGRSPDPRRIRRLKTPLAIEVEASEDGVPLRLRLGGGAWQDVTLVRRRWRIDQHWWRANPVRRNYFRVAAPDSPPLTIFYDLVSKQWSRQEYG